VPETDLEEIRRLYSSIKHPWLRRRLFDNVSQYLLHEAIHQRGEDDAIAMDAHHHRMAAYDISNSQAERVQQYVRIYSQLKNEVLRKGVEKSLKTIMKLNQL
tara:strand:+ start:445 stop:750 length:306 start_codon:yes stop_codon:yes gene_type:complete